MPLLMAFAVTPPPEVSDEFDDEFGPSSISKYGRTRPKVDTSVGSQLLPRCRTPLGY